MPGFWVGARNRRISTLRGGLSLLTPEPGAAAGVRGPSSCRSWEQRTVERVSIGARTPGSAPAATRAGGGTGMSLDPLPIRRDLSILERDEVIDLTEHREEHAADGVLGESDLDIAVLIPCHNEALTIVGVVSDFRRTLPTAMIYVYDNASTDDTAEIAAAARRSCATHLASARATCCGACSPRSRQPSTCSPTATARTTPRPCRSDRTAAFRAPRDGRRAAGRDRQRRRRVSTWAPAGQPRAHDFGELDLRRRLRRHALRLPGVLTPLREVVPGDVALVSRPRPR